MRLLDVEQRLQRAPKRLWNENTVRVSVRGEDESRLEVGMWEEREYVQPVLKTCSFALGVGCYPTWYLLGSGINFVSTAGNLLKEHTDIFTQKHKTCYLWAYAMTAINHCASCHLTFSLVFFPK